MRMTNKIVAQKLHKALVRLYIDLLATERREINTKTWTPDSFASKIHPVIRETMSAFQHVYCPPHPISR